MRRIVAEAAPRYVFAENVSRKAIDAAADDLESMGYSTRCIALAAADLGADHIRKRYWLRAYADGDSELHMPIDAEVARVSRDRSLASVVVPADGIPAGVAFRGFGNAIVPALAAELIGAYVEAVTA
jgi:DNA (cytosine-5)-methyltransferase 1